MISGGSLSDMFSVGDPVMIETGEGPPSGVLGLRGDPVMIETGEGPPSGVLVVLGPLVV